MLNVRQISAPLSRKNLPQNPTADNVIMDEFHYYSDHSRGAAWQIPLLTLPRARFKKSTSSLLLVC